MEHMEGDIPYPYLTPLLGTMYPNLYLIISNSLIINIAVKSINN